MHTNHDAVSSISSNRIQRIRVLLSVALIAIEYAHLTNAAVQQQQQATGHPTRYGRQSRSPGIAGGLFGNRWNVSPSPRCTYAFFCLFFCSAISRMFQISIYSTDRIYAVLSLFTVVQWGQSLCQAPSGEYGTCVPNNECGLRGGIPGGPCAEGYGICCVCTSACTFLEIGISMMIPNCSLSIRQTVMASCGGVARDNGTYFVNPNHPDAYDSTGSCQLSIQKIHPDICQIRLDFDNLVIAQPEPVNHICNTDQFLVSGGSPVPTICGTSTGDHSKKLTIYRWKDDMEIRFVYNLSINYPIVYIDTGVGQSNPIVVTVITSGTAMQRTWRIRITQIPCSSIAKADQGCLQYHSGVYGRVRSFNYDTTNGRQLSNQEYSVCVRTERNFCSIQYQSCPDVGECG